MIYGDDELASTMFHELSHQLVYIADDTAFNEAFAVTVEQEGLARWLAARGRAADLESYRARRARRAEALRVVARHREQLVTLYASGAQPADMRQRKAEEFAALVRELQALAARNGTQVRTGRLRSTVRLTMRGWPRWLPTTTACRASSACWKSSNMTCRASMTPCARSRSCRAKCGVSNSAAASHADSYRAYERVRENTPRGLARDPEP